METRKFQYLKEDADFIRKAKVEDKEIVLLWQDDTKNIF